MNRRIEPGLLVIFRYYAAVAMAYFALIISLTFRQEASFFSPYLRWSWLNLLVDAGLFIYLSSNWLRKKMGNIYLPAAFVIAVAFPAMSSLFDYFLPAGSELPIIIMRSWVLFPVLLVPLVLIAWQYRFRHVIIFTVLTTLLDEAMLIPGIKVLNLETLSILGQPLIRAFSFGFVGQIVTHLIDIQRAQQRILIQANMEISQHTKILEQLATSRERNRLARELHDTLAHTLSGLSISLEAMKTKLDPSQSEMQNALDQSLHAIRDGLNDTRRALKDLRSTSLEDMGLKLALQNQAAAVARRSGVQLQMEIADDIEIPPKVQQNVFRIAQEALENIVQHANAKNLALKLDYDRDILNLSIVDDGTGFVSSALEKENRFGIKGMRERAALINGSLEIEASPQKGTLVKLSVGLNHDQNNNL